MRTISNSLFYRETDASNSHEPILPPGEKYPGPTEVAVTAASVLSVEAKSLCLVLTMSRYPRFDTPESLVRRIREGRGSGDGKDWIGWHNTLDFISLGVRYQSYSSVNDRVLHHHSGLEQATECLIEYAGGVRQTKEQYPHSLSDSIKAATSIGKDHPRHYNGFPVVMTTDIVAEYDDVRVGYYVKPWEKLFEPRVLALLLIEYAIWRDVYRQPWFVVTERQLPQPLVRNITWTRPMLRPGALAHIEWQTIGEVEGWLRPLVEKRNRALADITSGCDKKMNLPPGRSLSIAKYLIGTKTWVCDLVSEEIVASTTRLHLVKANPVIR